MHLYQVLVLGIKPKEDPEEVDEREQEIELERYNIPSPEEMAEMARRHTEEALTPEERTLRWASAAGGATNL